MNIDYIVGVMWMVLRSPSKSNDPWLHQNNSGDWCKAYVSVTERYFSRNWIEWLNWYCGMTIVSCEQMSFEEIRGI